ncbi:MAG TPA: hypothetical protein DEB10_10690 [Ruminococcaceae bacterium]|nr:hypothetical protein [Oscillospiraceae bacterium]
MFYVGSRYYDPEIGRFINADDTDVLDVQADLYDKNLFAYCDNNPIVRVDHSGEIWELALAGGGTAGFSWGAFGTSILAGLGAITPVGWAVIIGAVVVVSVGAGVYYYSEHTKGARPSTKGKHEKGQTRKGRDKGGEKGDARRKPNPNKRNPRR